MTLAEERMRILKMVEGGQISAQEGSRLLETLEEQTQPRERSRPGSPRSLRVRVTDTTSNRQKINVTLPVGLINVGLKLGARLTPGAGAGAAVDTIMRAVASGATGRVYEMQDLEEGERIEIFVE
ncbi:MAG TPA: hypothetical protein VFS21_36190 [Roseiflexaceae bacterium]|nr:hypothetical protein [Roseiflexaceae bacterium]